jgi:hypothetical protein
MEIQNNTHANFNAAVARRTFLLVRTDQGCHIIAEEVVRGEGAVKFRQEQPNAMHDGSTSVPNACGIPNIPHL